MVRLAVLWSAVRGAFFFAVGVKVRGGSVLSALALEVPAILSASYLVVSGGLSLDVRLDLFPFDDFIIVYLRKYINMQIAQVFA